MYNTLYTNRHFKSKCRRILIYILIVLTLWGAVFILLDVGMTEGDFYIQSVEETCWGYTVKVQLADSLITLYAPSSCASGLSSIDPSFAYHLQFEYHEIFLIGRLLYFDPLEPLDPYGSYESLPLWGAPAALG